MRACVCVCCFLFIFHFICFDTEIGQLAKILSAGQIESVRPNAPKQPEYTCRFVEWKLCDWKIKKHRLDSVVVNIYVVIGWHFNSTASKLYRVPILRCGVSTINILFSRWFSVPIDSHTRSKTIHFQVHQRTMNNSNE